MVDIKSQHVHVRTNSVLQCIVTVSVVVELNAYDYQYP